MTEIFFTVFLILIVTLRDLFFFFCILAFTLDASSNLPIKINLSISLLGEGRERQESNGEIAIHEFASVDGAE